jgi:hypothetical protein
MRKYLIGALTAIVVIGALGYALSSRSRAHPAPPPAPAPARPTAPAPIATPATTALAVAAPRATSVIAVSGRVEKRAGAQWIELHVGDRLTAQDAIRTGEGAAATLDIGALVEVDDLTELTVGEISASLSQLALTEGRVTANAGEAGGITIRISTHDAGAIAETDRGRFDVLSSGDGQVTVAATEGDVNVTARDTTVIVPAGTLSTVQAGAAPSAPRSIPTSLFLKVSAAAQARDSAALRGETTPGAVVRINDVHAKADEHGRFTGDVPLHAGANTIIVSVVDALGRRERRVIQRTVRPLTPPRLEAQVEWK